MAGREKEARLKTCVVSVLCVGGWAGVCEWGRLRANDSEREEKGDGWVRGPRSNDKINA